MLEDYQKIQPEVQKEIADALEKFSAKLQEKQQYNLSKIQNHVHNGTDANKIPAASVASFIPIPSGPGGVFSSDFLGGTGGQNVGVGDQQLSPPIPQAVYVPPVPIVEGHGVGIYSQFNGGAAKNGTMVVFNNLGVANQLWIFVDEGWIGVDLPLSA